MSSADESEYEDGPSESEGFVSDASDNDDALGSGSSAKPGGGNVPEKPTGEHRAPDDELALNSA